MSKNIVMYSFLIAIFGLGIFSILKAGSQLMPEGPQQIKGPAFPKQTRTTSSNNLNPTVLAETWLKSPNNR